LESEKRREGRQHGGSTPRLRLRDGKMLGPRSLCALHSQTRPPLSKTSPYPVYTSKSLDLIPQESRETAVTQTTNIKTFDSSHLQSAERPREKSPRTNEKPNIHHVWSRWRRTWGRAGQSPAASDQLHFQAPATAVDCLHLALRAVGNTDRGQD